VSDPSLFPDFLRRIRAGDARAAEELVRRYEPAVRVAVRTRLTDPSLRRQFDSIDICQSVLASFFVRVGAGQFDLEEPSQLISLLVRMARNKLAMQARHHHRHRRDSRRAAGLDGDAALVAAPEPGPDRLAAGRELLEAVRARLTGPERELADLRGQGQSWEEIASALGGTPDARRMQLKRAIDRVAEELGLDLGGDDGI
jgi:RNA polymerase sigma-70 factor (ECF subfamily)